METINRPCTAFVGTSKIAEGDVLEVARKAKLHLDKFPDSSLLIFDDLTSAQVEIDFRGSADEVVERLSRNKENQSEKPGPGRPKLGVVSREIGLLPRHWEWLALQPGGASVTLRKLVEEARKANSHQDRIRQSQEATYKFMTAMAGNLPHFEEALRAFYARNKALFETLTLAWPEDIRKHLFKIGEVAMSDSARAQ
ncbi:DUF2239 family protein [Oligoflexus tunisiensis]|uniref:DUF2239 family protein n=1 Tax=Oligoflexus tunisiensis TaxID=708132 RepID=UPI000AF59B79|nr:DUF2239 family protein [Oligoflexus tunisiensis]